jgi:transcriptional regulator with XRE-family HTH domain
LAANGFIGAMAIGERLTEARESKGLTQAELVRKSGVAERTLRDIESGVTQNPSTATVKRLAAALGVPAEQIMGDEPVERPAPKSRAAATGPKSAREALADETHYLRYLFRRAGLVTDEEQAKAAAAFDERFKQLWLFYLGYCEAGFRTGRTDVVQLELAKPA